MVIPIILTVKVFWQE